MNLQFTMPTSSLKNTNLHANKKPPFPKVGPARWSCRQPRLLHRPPPGKKPHHLSSLPSRMLYTTSSRPTSSTSPAAIVELLNQRVALNQRVDPTYETENWYATIFRCNWNYMRLKMHSKLKVLWCSSAIQPVNSKQNQLIPCPSLHNMRYGRKFSDWADVQFWGSTRIKCNHSVSWNLTCKENPVMPNSLVS